MAENKYPGILSQITEGDKHQALYRGLLNMGANMGGYSDKPVSFMNQLTQGGQGFAGGYQQEMARRKADYGMDLKAKHQQAQMEMQRMQIEKAKQEKALKDNWAAIQRGGQGNSRPDGTGMTEQDAFVLAYPDLIAKQRAESMYGGTTPSGRPASGIQYFNKIQAIRQMPDGPEKTQMIADLAEAMKATRVVDTGPSFTNFNPLQPSAPTNLQKGLKPSDEQAGPIAAAKAQGTQSIKAAGDAFASLGSVNQNLANIDNAIAALDQGAKTGPIVSMLPNITKASVELANVRNRMGLDVIGSVTFGALSKGELDLALSTALPTNLEPGPLREWLTKKRDAQQKLARYYNEAAIFLSKPGNTVGKWAKKRKGDTGHGKQDTNSGEKPDIDSLLEKYPTGGQDG